jgi:hypothetical protein
LEATCGHVAHTPVQLREALRLQMLSDESSKSSIS